MQLVFFLFLKSSLKKSSIFQFVVHKSITLRLSLKNVFIYGLEKRERSCRCQDCSSNLSSASLKRDFVCILSDMRRDSSGRRAKICTKCRLLNISSNQIIHFQTSISFCIIYFYFSCWYSLNVYAVVYSLAGKRLFQSEALTWKPVLLPSRDVILGLMCIISHSSSRAVLCDVNVPSEVWLTQRSFHAPGR